MKLKIVARKNVSSETIINSFNEKVMFSNGVYTTGENSLTIFSKDYNGTILVSGSIGDVGFIVSESNSLKIKYGVLSIKTLNSYFYNIILE